MTREQMLKRAYDAGFAYAWTKEGQVMTREEPIQQDYNCGFAKTAGAKWRSGVLLPAVSGLGNRSRDEQLFGAKRRLGLPETLPGFEGFMSKLNWRPESRTATRQQMAYGYQSLFKPGSGRLPAIRELYRGHRELSPYAIRSLHAGRIHASPVPSTVSTYSPIVAGDALYGLRSTFKANPRNLYAPDGTIAHGVGLPFKKLLENLRSAGKTNAGSFHETVLRPDNRFLQQEIIRTRPSASHGTRVPMTAQARRVWASLTGQKLPQAAKTVKLGVRMRKVILAALKMRLRR